MTGLAVPLWERWIWMKTGVLQIRLLIQIKLFNSISTVPRVQHLISSHVDILSNYCPSCRPFSQVWSSLSLWHLFLPRCSLSPKRAKSSSKCLHWWNPKSSINVNPSKHVTNDSPILISIYTYIYKVCIYIYVKQIHIVWVCLKIVYLQFQRNCQWITVIFATQITQCGSHFQVHIQISSQVGLKLYTNY